MESMLMAKTDMTKLATVQAWPCATIYAPIIREGYRTKAGELQLAHLHEEVKATLIDEGLPPEHAAALLQPVEQAAGQGFREIQGDRASALAFFLAPDFQRVYLSSKPLPATVQVDRHFELRPMLEFHSLNGGFFVLALSQSQARLFHGSADALQPVELAVAPQVNAKDLGRQAAARGGSAALGGTGRIAARDLEAADQQNNESILEEFVKSIVHEVRRTLAGGDFPLVLVGTREPCGLARKHLDYPYLLAEGIDISPDRLSSEELGAQVWPLIREHVSQARHRQLERYRNTLGTRFSASTVPDILQAAAAGQIDVLLAAAKRTLHGREGSLRGEIELHAERQPGDTEFVSAAIKEAFAKGSKVYLVEDDALPADCPMGAILRW